MVQALAFVGGAVLVVGGLFVFPLLGAFFGGVSGWIVGIFFGDAILGLFAALGVKGISMWQLGVTLGFVGGFFRSSSSSSNKD